MDLEAAKELFNDDEYWENGPQYFLGSIVDENSALGFGLTDEDIEGYKGKSTDAIDVMCDILKEKGILTKTL